MKHRIVPFVLLLALAFGGVPAALAQVASPPVPQPVPSADGSVPSDWPPSTAFASPTSGPQSTIPPGATPGSASASSGATAATYSMPQNAVNAPPPGSLLIQPEPSTYPTPWQPPVAPHLGLIPGDEDSQWSVAVDALWLTRCSGSDVLLGVTDYNYASHVPQQVRTQPLWSNDEYFPLAPGMRLQVTGRLSDRSAIEVNAWGLQQWSIGRTIYGDPEYGSVLAYSPWLQLSNTIGGFDDSLGYRYDSQVANVELNYRIKLVSYDPYRSFSWLWGVRYFHLADDFSITGNDIYTNSRETLEWHTQNNLFGGQLGLQWAWGWDRFQLTTEVKGGLFANPYSQDGFDSGYSSAQFYPQSLANSGTDLAALFEFSIGLRCRLTQCSWFRAGYQYYGVTGLAVGPRQLDGCDASGSVGFDGLSLGFEIVR